MKLKLNQVYTYSQDSLNMGGKYLISICDEDNAGFYHILSYYHLPKIHSKYYLVEFKSHGEIVNPYNPLLIPMLIGHMWHRDYPEEKEMICANDSIDDNILVEYTGQPIDEDEHPGQIWNAIDQEWKWF